MCALDVKPLSLVNGVGFKYFLAALNPDYKVPSPPTVRAYLTKVYDDIKPQVINLMANYDIAITTDMWTSLTMTGYITVTCHFINSNWELVSTVVATRPVDAVHSGEVIAQRLSEILQEFAVPHKNVAGLVTDNASNMVVAGNVTQFLHVRCFSHTLQLCIGEALKIPAISRAVAAAKRVVKHFNQSSKASRALHAYQVNTGVQRPLCLIQDVCTRWNSTFLLMQRLIKLRVAVYSVIFDDKITKPSDRAQLDISDANWKVMEDVTPVLEPFAEATQLLTAESTPTLSSVPVVLQALYKGTAEGETDSGTVKELKKKLGAGLMQRFDLNKSGGPAESAVKSAAVIAAALDPWYKSLRFLEDHMRGQVKDHLLHLIEGGMATEVTPTIKMEQEEQGPTTPTPAKKLLMDCIKGDAIDLTTDTETSKGECQLESYFRESVKTNDPLKWWASKNYDYNDLAKLAKKFLCIPATEVPSERVFSTAGQTITKYRASLDPGTVDEIIFINKNYPREQVQGIVPAVDVPCTSVDAPPQKTEDPPMPPLQMPPLPALPGLPMETQEEATMPGLVKSE